eukprot:8350806-Pyramimonas_sp.AAC.1
MQKSELGLILELGLQNYSYSSSHLERCCRFTHTTRSFESYTARTEDNLEASAAFGCASERSEIAWAENLFFREALRVSAVTKVDGLPPAP